MKRIYLLSIVLLITFNKHQAQDVSREEFTKLSVLVKKLEEKNDNLRFDYDTLRLDYDTLSNSYSELKEAKDESDKKLLRVYKLDFDELSNSVIAAFDKTDVISNSALYQGVLQEIIKLHNKIAKIQNFTDAQEVFGIDFMSQIKTIAEESLVSQMVEITKNEKKEIAESRKKRFREIVKSLVENPVVSGLMKSNPISSVAHSIINQTMSAQSTKITDVRIQRDTFDLPVKFRDFKNDYSKFKKSYESTSLVGMPESKRLVLNSSIDTFTSKIEPFINLFDELSKIGDKYESSLDVFMKANEQTIKRAEPVETKFYELLEVDNRTAARTKIQKFFNVGTAPTIDILESKLNDTMMKKVMLYADEVNEVSLLLKNDFLKIITVEIELTDEYIKFFNSLRTGRRKMPVFSSTEKLDEKITEFEKFKSKLTKYKNKLEEKKKNDE